MASIPTVLYYLSCFLMIEADSRRMHTTAVMLETPPLIELTLAWLSLYFLIACRTMATGMTAFMAVFIDRDRLCLEVFAARNGA